MDILDLTEEQCQLIAWACCRIRLHPWVPSYLQDFIAERLFNHSPELASQVLLFSPEEMQELCDWVVEQQSASVA